MAHYRPNLSVEKTPAVKDVRSNPGASVAAAVTTALEYTRGAKSISQVQQRARPGGAPSDWLGVQPMTRPCAQIFILDFKSEAQKMGNRLREQRTKQLNLVNLLKENFPQWDWISAMSDFGDGRPQALRTYGVRGGLVLKIAQPHPPYWDLSLTTLDDCPGATFRGPPGVKTERLVGGVSDFLAATQSLGEHLADLRL